MQHLSSHTSPSALRNLKRKFPWIFLAISLICFSAAGYLMWERYYNPYNLDFGTPSKTVSSDSKITFLPVRIHIPDLNIDLPVIPARITDSHWPTNTEGVSYLLVSARPGKTGNSIYYGHNWPRLLGNLYKIKPGQTITILTSDGNKVNYIVSSIDRVSPNDTGILDDSLLRELTIYTCTGFADSQRLVVKALYRYQNNPN